MKPFLINTTFPPMKEAFPLTDTVMFCTAGPEVIFKDGNTGKEIGRLFDPQFYAVMLGGETHLTITGWAPYQEGFQQYKVELV